MIVASTSEAVMPADSVRDCAARLPSRRRRNELSSADNMQARRKL